MNKSLLVGVGVGIIIAAAAGAVASYSNKHSTPNTQALTAPLPANVSVAPPAPAMPAELKTTEPSPHTAAPAEAAATAAVVANTVHPAHSAASPAREKRGNGAAAPQFARVVSSTAVVQTERVPREACHDEQVKRQKPVKDEKRIAGTALGALLGGVLGNQVGGGDGKKLATAAGAIAGGVAGSKIQRRVQEGNTEMVTEKRCTTVYDSKEKVLGYDVAYRIGNETHTQRMSISPEIGAKLPVSKDGQVLAAAHSGF
jgi:uncharacterized protein YcfJ